eukprot:10667914-Ditylum_brightwellii.AAC.1
MTIYHAPLTYDPIEYDDLEKIDVYINALFVGAIRNNRKYSIPVYDGESEEHYLYVLREFENTVTKAGIRNHAARANELYECFREALQGDAQDRWDDILFTHAIMPRTPLTFTAHQDMLTSTILEEDAAELQEQYLKNTKK